MKRHKRLIVNRETVRALTNKEITLAVGGRAEVPSEPGTKCGHDCWPDPPPAQ